MPANHLILAQTIERSEENGGNLEVKTADELDQVFSKEQLHPADLKAFVAQELNNFVPATLRNPQTKKHAN